MTHGTIHIEELQIAPSLFVEATVQVGSSPIKAQPDVGIMCDYNEFNGDIDIHDVKLFDADGARITTLGSEEFAKASIESFLRSGEEGAELIDEALMQ